MLLDYESAPIKPAGLPTAHTEEDELDEKKDLGSGDYQDHEVQAVESADGADGDQANEHEMLTLRKVPAPMGWPAVSTRQFVIQASDSRPLDVSSLMSESLFCFQLAMTVIELAERASYYGCTGVFSNFVRRPLPAGGPGTGAV